MNTKSLRILALAAIVAWQGTDAIRAQQPAAAAGGQGQATNNGLEQFQAVPALRNAITVAYQQPVETMPAPAYSAEGYMPAQGGAPYEVGYEQGYGDGQYVNSYPTYDEGYVDGAPMGFFDSIYPAGHCYAYTRGEALVLTHNIQSDQPFTSRGPAGPIVLSANDLDLEFKPGIRVVAGVPVTHCTMIEASYFGLHEFHSTASVVDPTDFLFSVYSGFGTQPGFIVQGRNVFDFFDGSRRQAIEWDSELHSAEANLLYRVPLRSCKQEGWLLAGLRYVKVMEQLQYFTESGPNDPVLLIRTSRTAVQTDNDLIGVQLGGILHHHVTKKLRVSLDGKAGMAVNLHEQRTFITTNLFPLGSEELSDDALAMTVDAGVALSFDVNCWFSITGGYRMTYLDGLALALENFNPVLPGTGLRQPGLDDDGSVLYHGGHLGAEIRW
jgi:hypothetical protein